jgi:hypothetical protein
MKTKTFFFICLLLGIVTTKLSAQTVNAIEPKWFDHYLEIFCNGVQVDYLKNEGYDLRQSTHYKDGNYTWRTGKVNNLIYISEWTDEVFKVQVKDGWNMKDNLYQNRTNVIGNKGSHYIIEIVCDGTTWELIGSSTDCH